MFVIIGLMIGVYFYYTNDDIQYGISLIDAGIPVGTDAQLSYEINNGWFSNEKNNVRLYYYVESEGREDEQVVSFGTVYPRESESGTANIPTSHLPPGKYTIRTDLEYYNLGKGRMKFLTLELTIY